jgi:site-specific recombinase XerD
MPNNTISRHRYATQLLQSGTNLRYIKKIRGNAVPKTTMLYTYVTVNDLRKHQKLLR